MFTRTHRPPINSRVTLPSCPKISLFILYVRNVYYILYTRSSLYLLFIYLFFFLLESWKMKKWKELLRQLDTYIYSLFLIEFLSTTDDRERMKIFLFKHGTCRKEDNRNSNSHVITRKIEWRIIIEDIYNY